MNPAAERPAEGEKQCKDQRRSSRRESLVTKAPLWLRKPARRLRDSAASMRAQTARQKDSGSLIRAGCRRSRRWSWSSFMVRCLINRPELARVTAVLGSVKATRLMPLHQLMCGTRFRRTFNARPQVDSTLG
jgi:hypothetical protein